MNYLYALRQVSHYQATVPIYMQKYPTSLDQIQNYRVKITYAISGAHFFIFNCFVAVFLVRATQGGLRIEADYHILAFKCFNVRFNFEYQQLS